MLVISNGENEYCDYQYHNGGGGCNCIKWIRSTSISFHVENVAPNKSRLECKVFCLTHVCIAMCQFSILYVHSTNPRMFKACIHLGVHDHHVSNDTCRESLDMAYRIIANEVMKTLIAKNYAASKLLLANYLLKSPSNGKRPSLGTFVFKGGYG